MNNKTDFKTDWEKKKNILKQKFHILTDDDLLFEKWEKNEMISHLQTKLEESKEMIYKLISNL